MRRLVLREELRPEDGVAAAEWLAGFELVLDATAPGVRRIGSLRDRTGIAAISLEDLQA